MEYFFIVGCPRSGTTVVQQALNRHSEIVVPAETKYFNYFYGMPLRWQQIHLMRLSHDLGIEIERPQSRVCGVEDHLRFFSDIATKYISASGKKAPRLFGEKTPEHTGRIPAIREIFPESKLVFVYRDPRAVVASLRRVPWIRCGVRAASLIWKRYNDVFSELTSCNDADLIPVRYEELVASPRQTLTKVCSKLGVEYEEAMATGTGSQSVLPSREFPWKARALERIESDRVEAWRDQLKPFEVHIIERVVGNSMLQLDYLPETDQNFRLKAFDYPWVAFDCLCTLTSLTFQCLLSESLWMLSTTSRQQMVVKASGCPGENQDVKAGVHSKHS